MMPMQTTIVRFRSPKKGRKQNFSRKTPKAETMATESTKARSSGRPKATLNW